MQFSSKLVQSKQYNTPIIRQNYNSTSSNSKISTPNQRLQEIRRKYDTPNRRQLKEIQTKNVIEKPFVSQDMELRKSFNSAASSGFSNAANTSNTKWNNDDKPKQYEMSPVAHFRKQNMINQEQNIFKKIKQMKDSLLQKNYNDKIKTTKSIYQPRFSQKMEPKPPAIDRLQNDRINAKFQQILNCLKENQNKTALLQNQFNEKGKDRIQLRQSTRLTTDSKFSPMSSKLQTIEARSTQPFTHSYSHSFSQSQSQNNDQKPFALGKPHLTQSAHITGSSYQNKIQLRNTASIYHEKDDKTKYKMISPAPKVTQSFETQSNRGEGSKVRSFISSIQKQTKGLTSNKYEMRSGKKLDDQISKIESKIQQFQQQKRKLNIDFKPYSYSNSKSTTNLTKRSYTIDKYQRPLNNLNERASVGLNKPQEPTFGGRRTLQNGSKYYDKVTETRQTKNTTRFTLDQTREKNIQAASINVHIKKNEKSMTQSEENSLFKIKLIPVEAEQKSSTSSSRVENRLLSEDFRKKTDEGILQRKKKITAQSSKRSKIATKKLVQKLSSQAQLDQTFRNNKLYFESSMNNKKWDELEQQLKKQGHQIPRQKAQKIFKITDEQNNPFFSVRQNCASIQGLVRSYVDSEQHWKKELYKKHCSQELTAEDFTSNSLDLQKKGYVVLQDIVRFLNMETGTFYRNRDLYLIFRRISEHEKINFNQLIQTFCK